MIAAAIVVLAAVLAFANGANDVSKGVATLVGSGVTSYRRAIVWGTAWTAVGAALAAIAAGAMLARFGSGLYAAGITPSLPAVVGALVGAGLWVLIATRSGLPVSTTHALVGAVVGAGVTALGAHAIAWPALTTKVALPLIVSPFVAMALTHLVSRGLTRGFGPAATGADCVCVSPADCAPVATAIGTAFALSATTSLVITAADSATCAIDQPAAARVTTTHMHWLSSGAVSFARGLNDAPKIAGLSLAAGALIPAATTLGQGATFALITAGIVAGSIAAGRRVTRVLAEDVTPMNHREGFAANLVTAGLVSAGAVYGWPMSTTHVSAGSIMAIGADRGSLDRRTARNLVLAWVVTLPAAAALGALSAILARVVLGA